MEVPEHGWIEATLCARFADESSVVIVTEAIVSIWQEIETVLRPVIGQRGVAALYQRSLVITARTYSWLPPPDSSSPVLDMEPLIAAIAQQAPAMAIKAGGSLLQNFYDLLSGLIGPSLSQRLLRSVGANLFGGHPPQDTSPCPEK